MARAPAKPRAPRAPRKPRAASAVDETVLVVLPDGSIDLSAFVQPTVNAIWAARQAQGDSGFRAHLGASLIGKECRRALWYDFRWATRRVFSGRMQNLFRTGQDAEVSFVADLRLAGVTVYEVDPDTGKQYRCLDTTGHFGGSCDGIVCGLLEAPATPHVAEFKTHNERSFREFVQRGVALAKPLHFAQMQTYMHFFGLTRAFYLARNKNDDDLHSERVRYDAAVAEQLVAKAHSVIAADAPPARIAADPTCVACSLCDHIDACFNSRRPERHCRSCAHSTPIEDGQWHCARWEIILDIETQREGCPKHVYIPETIDGEQVDAADDASWVEYRLRDGTRWLDGEGRALD